MFLRRHRKEAGGENYEYWVVGQNDPRGAGPLRQVVARLGKLDGLEVQTARGWNNVDALLGGSPQALQLSLAPEPAREPLWKEIDVRGLRVERLRHFGGFIWAWRCGGGWGCISFRPG